MREAMLRLLRCRYCKSLVPFLVAAVMPLGLLRMMKMHAYRLPHVFVFELVVTRSSHMLFSNIVTLADRVSDCVAMTFCTDIIMRLIIESKKTSY
jgi:hypothetical protein